MRGRTSKTLAVTACLTLVPAALLACESATQNEGYKLKRVNSDCSFANGGRGQFETFSGEAVVDIGNGRIGQRVNTGDGCSPKQSLFFQNCTSGEGIVIDGEHWPTNIAGYVPSSIDLIQKPKGPIGLTTETTVAELKQIASENRYSFTADIKKFFARTKNHKRIDYACGCKLYYPDSPGAKL